MQERGTAGTAAAHDDNPVDGSQTYGGRTGAKRDEEGLVDATLPCSFPFLCSMLLSISASRLAQASLPRAALRAG